MSLVPISLVRSGQAGMSMRAPSATSTSMPRRPSIGTDSWFSLPHTHLATSHSSSTGDCRSVGFRAQLQRWIAHRALRRMNEAESHDLCRRSAPGIGRNGAPDPPSGGISRPYLPRDRCRALILGLLEIVACL